MIKSFINKWLKHVEHFGYKNKFVRFVLISMVFVFNVYVDVVVYISYPLEQHMGLFAIWIVSGLIGSYFIGWLSDNSRKIAFLLSQFLGVIGLLILFFTGFNIWILCFLAIFYNPATVIRAIFIHELHDKTFLRIVLTDPRIIAITQILQAFPWMFYSWSENANSILPVEVLVISQSVLFFLTFFFFSDDRDQHVDHTEDPIVANPAQAFVNVAKVFLNRANGLPLLGFMCAETVYFLSAYYIVVAHFANDEKAGTMFFIIVIGVFVGSILHFLIAYKLYHLSYRILISSIYGLSGLLIGLVTLASWEFGIEQAIPVFIGAIAFLGAWYIPLFYSFLFQVLHARHRGIASAIGEGAQGLASFFAALLMGGLHLIPHVDDHLPYVIGITLAILYFMALFLSLGNDQHD